ncbi:LPD7 domain-containing protein [Cupriavidus nantongensis]|uniref:Uncharacterized protein n=1 Tax=Cupriavidus nantongensis TaxID=1796606 RepID=A0A142JIY7_9BURK|nr:LPD7 domain-containing protein [Cupriavidus nantongensis]AMR78049.1 hypothetical protein A2G96_10000 [Cupriavidus nantongensis]
MAEKSKVEQLKERFAQQARAGIPFNPVDGVDIKGANVERLKVGMETFGWKDYRFVTAEQARANGWTVPAKANTVRITTRNAANGSVGEKTLYNASNVRGMPSLEAMLAMSDEALLKMRGEDVEAEAPEAQQSVAEPEADTPAPAGGEVEDDVVIGPAPGPERSVALVQDAEPEGVTDLFLGEPVGELDSPVEQVATADVANRPDVAPAQAAPTEPAVEADFAVMAPYWLDGLHNYEGIELARQVNQLIEAEKLAKNKAAIATLLSSYPDSRSLGVDIVARSKYLNDPHLKANTAEPTQLLGGELVRDKEGAYRPTAGGLAVLQDKGTSLVLKNKTEQAYRGAMELALAKGWKAIELKGKPKMLAQAWLEAQMMGLQVVNYTPTEQDRERLAQRMAEEVRKREAAAARAEALTPETVEVRPVVDATGKEVMATVKYTVARTGTHTEPSNAANDPEVTTPFDEPVVTRTVTRVDGLVRDDVVAGVTKVAARGVGYAGQARSAIAASLVDHEVDAAMDEVRAEQTAIVDLEKGARLVAHGAAPYDHNPKNKASYFVTVESESGQSRTVWGKDLERSLSAAGAQPGDVVSLIQGGREPVEVEVEGPDGTKDWKTAHRVNWNTAVLSRAAEVAQEPTVDVASSGLFLGPVVRVEEGRIAQKAGRDPNKLVWHDISKLQGKVPGVGDWAEINYSGGVGQVKEQQSAQELAR